MQHEFEEGIEDVAAAIASGRGIKSDGPYGILIGDETLNYRAAVVRSATVTGAQILAAAGVGNPVEHVAFQVLQGGQLESLRPDESVDLRSAGAERFVIFRSDRIFRILVDDRTLDWGASRITGGTIKRLIGAKAFTHDVWQVLPSGGDHVVGDEDFVDLTAPGVERFVIKPISIRVIVNARPREVHKRVLTYWDVVKLAFPEAVAAPNTVYSITYARGPHRNPEGSMVDGQQVWIKDGMTFYVTVTDKS
ncbi:multiubiquitin domain-containing protein [Roseateles sp. NT4]|uniref:multiubiquitin domain-containing protein n=1 Tax=Roseateles sp. NT4 TaxID=3453715 RepID=UPI003EEFAEDE